MLNLVITCGDHYPDVPPEVKFVSKISMNCVDKNGRVRLALFDLLKSVQDELADKEMIC